MTFKQIMLLNSDQFQHLAESQSHGKASAGHMYRVCFSDPVYHLPGDNFWVSSVSERTIEVHLPCCSVDGRYSAFQRRIGFVAAMAGAEIKYTRRYVWVINLPETSALFITRVAYLMALQAREILCEEIAANVKRI